MFVDCGIISTVVSSRYKTSSNVKFERNQVKHLLPVREKTRGMSNQMKHLLPVREKLEIGDQPLSHTMT